MFNELSSTITSTPLSSSRNENMPSRQLPADKVIGDKFEYIDNFDWILEDDEPSETSLELLNDKNQIINDEYSARVLDVPCVPASIDKEFEGTDCIKTDVPGVLNINELIDDAISGSEEVVDDKIATAVTDDERPCYRVYDDWTLLDSGIKIRAGVWYFGFRSNKKDGSTIPVDTWVCGPLHIQAQTLDRSENNFGRLLRFKNTAGRWREWAMPMEMLKNDGSDLRGELLAMGLEINPSTRQALQCYLQNRTPKQRVRCSTQVGWCDSVFVLPDAVIGPNSQSVIFQTGDRSHDEYGQAGTIEGWQSRISARAIGNPLLLLGLSAAFAGPLLMLTNTEGGGLHFFGDSSCGKTTILECACSVWGGPSYRRSWRATANGMEGAAALFNDCLLAVDEISECDPKDVGAIVYSLGNGRGKQRASRTGAARAVNRWSAFIVSSGELTVGTTIIEGGQRNKAGQSVRLLDLPATRKFGAWDDLHDTESGAAFSDALKQASVMHHGRAGRAFLDQVTHDQRDMTELLRRYRMLSGLNPKGAEGQVKRAASRFALLALAGELATEYGITGWGKGAASEAAEEGFRIWQAMRGRGNDERRKLLDQLAAFIERHGDSRFSEWTENDVNVRDRAGWWRTVENDERLYLFSASGLREALKGFDFVRSLDMLTECGIIPAANSSGEHSKTETICGHKVRVYHVRPNVLDGNLDTV